jgi:hypothetical protein
MNYQVRVTSNVWAGTSVVLAKLIEPHVEHEQLHNYIECRALEIQKARNLPLPAIVLIEKQD